MSAREAAVRAWGCERGVAVQGRARAWACERVVAVRARVRVRGRQVVSGAHHGFWRQQWMRSGTWPLRRGGWQRSNGGYRAN